VHDDGLGAVQGGRKGLDLEPKDGPWIASIWTRRQASVHARMMMKDGVNRSQDGDRAKSRRAHEHLVIERSRTSGTCVDIVEKAY